MPSGLVPWVSVLWWCGFPMRPWGN